MNEIIRDLSEEILVTVPDIESGSALKIFTTQDDDGNPIGCAEILNDLKDRIDAFAALGLDAGTKADRERIKSFAYKIRQAKSKIEATGKELADQQKAIPKRIDAARRFFKDTIDKWHDEIRKPLTDWETAEEARIKKHTDALERITTLGKLCNARSEQYRACLDEVKAVEVGPACDEFVAEYAIAKETATSALAISLAAQERREQDERDLARLRAAEAERQRKEEEERLRKEGEERARLEAEADARAEKERAERKLADEKAAAEKRERELQQAREDAERRAKEAAEEERRKIAIEQEEREREQRRREADVAHRAEINRAALTAFVAGGIDEATAKLAIKLIVTEQIPAIRIHY